MPAATRRYKVIDSRSTSYTARIWLHHSAAGAIIGDMWNVRKRTGFKR
jgi:hypothetical protein